MNADPHRILIVDDDPDIRDTLCDLLEEEGYRTTGLANGREALDYLTAHARPSVILLDLMMPVMDGWTFRNLQLADPALADIPVVLISAANELGPIAARIPRILRKPLRLEQVLQTIRDSCAG